VGWGGVGWGGVGWGGVGWGGVGWGGVGRRPEAALAAAAFLRNADGRSRTPRALLCLSAGRPAFQDRATHTFAHPCLPHTTAPAPHRTHRSHAHGHSHAHGKRALWRHRSAHTQRAHSSQCGTVLWTGCVRCAVTALPTPLHSPTPPAHIGPLLPYNTAGCWRTLTSWTGPTASRRCSATGSGALRCVQPVGCYR
jgi:hypothetical protein